MVDLLLKNGANVNIGDYYGRSPIYMAARNGNKNIVQMLISKGADVNLADDTKETPLTRARQRGTRLYSCDIFSN